MRSPLGSSRCCASASAPGLTTVGHVALDGWRRSQRKQAQGSELRLKNKRSRFIARTAGREPHRGGGAAAMRCTLSSRSAHASRPGCLSFPIVFDESNRIVRDFRVGLPTLVVATKDRKASLLSAEHERRESDGRGVRPTQRFFPRGGLLRVVGSRPSRLSPLDRRCGRGPSARRLATLFDASAAKGRREKRARRRSTIEGAIFFWRGLSISLYGF
jgi:hypothetical protein